MDCINQRIKSFSVFDYPNNILYLSSHVYAFSSDEVHHGYQTNSGNIAAMKAMHFCLCFSFNGATAMRTVYVLYHQ